VSAKAKKKAKRPGQGVGGGRPSLKDSLNLDQVEVIASLGLIDEEIAVVLGIQKSTLNNWKKDPKFLDSLKRGKLKADFQVTKSLFNKATGKRVVVEQTPKGPVEKTITVDPDTSAIIFWLKNRRPDLWRDRQQIDGNFHLTGKLSMAELQKSIKGTQDAVAGN